MTRRELALSLLEDAGERGVTTAEFIQSGVGSRYGARIMELRKQGHQITSERIRDGSWRYTLDVDVGGNADREDPIPPVDVPSGAESLSRLPGSASVGERAGGAQTLGAPGHLFAPPDAYEELRKKDGTATPGADGHSWSDPITGTCGP